MRVILLGLLSALFFSTTFILNRAMELDGSSWIWSASLRFFFMLPILLVVVGVHKSVKPIFHHLKQHPIQWIIWSTIGFGLFYTPITFATVYGPGWLVAATFQLTIIAGSLLTPFLSSNKAEKQSIPLKSILISGIILIGIFLMQLQHATQVPLVNVLLCVIPLIISAFAYPLGNRKMMQIASHDLTTFQRILGMTIASMPFWLLLSGVGLVKDGLPSYNQLIQTLIVAVCSGIIATVLFFSATELVKDDAHKLAAVEATQSGEVVFALIGELLFLNAPLPSLLSFAGIMLVIVGMLLHSFYSVPTSRRKKSHLSSKTLSN